ncbi:MAG: hypothetical protein KDK36_07000 [Leptospiraceae bacterium]|nr:hypothetical protein [Leptospiraceae bacterium]
MRTIFFIFFLLGCGSIGKDIQKTELGPDFNFFISETDPLPPKRGLTAEHYPASNERRIDLFMPYIDGLGGGYIGVGTDQNLSFIAKAKSECVFLMDFDPEIVKVNRLHFLFFSKSSNYEEYRQLWDPKKKKEVKEKIKEWTGENSNDFLSAFDLGHKGGFIPNRLKAIDYMNKKFGLITFAQSPEQFNHLKNLIKNKRIQAIEGNLKGNISMKKIAEKAAQMNCPIRLMYTSNAEEYFNYPKEFRENILALPVDEKGYIIRTISVGTKGTYGFPDGEMFPDTYPFHYNMQKLQNLKKWMRLNSPLKVMTLLQARKKISKGFSEITKTPEEIGIKE